MSSPEVWAEARSIIEAGAAALGVPVAWPNEKFPGLNPYREDGTAQRWLLVETAGDLSDPFGMGGEVWEETGSVTVHVMGPTGAGIADALALRKAVANLFRFRPAGPVTWKGAILDPGGDDEDGNWHRTTVRVRYSFTDR